MNKKRLIRNWHRKKISVLSIVVAMAILLAMANNVGALQSTQNVTSNSYINNYIQDTSSLNSYTTGGQLTDLSSRFHRRRTYTPTPTPTVTHTPTPTVAPTVAPTNTPIPTVTVIPTPTSTPPSSVVPILEDHFQGTSINQNVWTNLYNGPAWLPSGDAGSYFRPSNIIVNNGLHLRVIRENYNGLSYTSGGLSTSYSISQGRVEVRARFPRGDSGLVGYLLLWPADGSWPPEIDFAETNGVNANFVGFTQHWGTSSNPYEHTDSTNIDVTQFHTYTIDVINGELKWYIDGNLIATQKQNFNTRKFTFSAGVWAGACDGSYGGCPSNTVLPQYMDIDYIKMYDSIPN